MTWESRREIPVQRFLSLFCVLFVWSGAPAQQKPSSIFPESTIANVSLEGFLPDGRHYRAIVYLSGSFSSSYYAPVTPGSPEGYVSDGWTNDEQFFVLAEAAFSSAKGDEVDLPTRKEMQDAAFSDASSKYKGHVVIVISPITAAKLKAKAFMRKHGEKFTSVRLRELEQLLLSVCDKRAR
jgi:hypothetical protein